jgi:hypothetical protein
VFNKPIAEVDLHQLVAKVPVEAPQVVEALAKVAVEHRHKIFVFL